MVTFGHNYDHDRRRQQNEPDTSEQQTDCYGIVDGLGGRGLQPAAVAVAAMTAVRSGEHAAAEPAFFFRPIGFTEKWEKYKCSYKQKHNIVI